MNAHTAGPWVISHDDEQRFSDTTLKAVRVAHKDGGAIADTYVNCLVDTDEACRANANLIAAAPDLLAALEFMLDRFEDEAGKFSQRLACGRAKAAIADAKGESE